MVSGVWVEAHLEGEEGGEGCEGVEGGEDGGSVSGGGEKEDGF